MYYIMILILIPLKVSKTGIKFDASIIHHLVWYVKYAYPQPLMRRKSRA